MSVDEAASSSTPPPRRPPLLVDLGAGLLALVLVGAAATLGFWQLESWQLRRTAEARDLTKEAPVALAEVMGNDDPFPAPDVGRPVEVSGTWIDGGFWVADRSQDGREGFWAVTPLAVGGEGNPAVLVVRGWAPDTDGEHPTGDAEVVGWLQPPEGSLVVDDDASDDVFPEIRVADAVQRVDVDLFSAYVVADTDQTAAEVSQGLAQAQLDALPEPGRFTALRNLLYAVEWWVFGTFAAFIWWRWRRDVTQGTTEAPSEPTPSEESPAPR
jgi:cytochrome oxidase assembly protein ShyY1